MMLTSPVKEFFSRAVFHAKEDRVHRLNYLEAELIMLEEDVSALKQSSKYVDELGPIEKNIEELKKLLNKKKTETR